MLTHLPFRLLKTLHQVIIASTIFESLVLQILNLRLRLFQLNQQFLRICSIWALLLYLFELLSTHLQLSLQLNHPQPILIGFGYRVLFLLMIGYLLQLLYLFILLSQHITNLFQQFLLALSLLKIQFYFILCNP